MKPPPRQVWLIVFPEGWTYMPTTTRAAALKRKRDMKLDEGRVVGPYVLAERRRER